MSTKYFSRVFLQILESSIAEDFNVRHVFEDLIKLADWRTGVVDKTRGAIARKLNIPLDELNRCIGVLEAPDPQSRSKKADGRRITRLDDGRDWGWRIVNWEEYNGRLERAAAQERVERHRERRKLESRGLTGGNTPETPPADTSEEGAIVPRGTGGENTPVDPPPAVHPPAEASSTPVIPKLEDFEVWAMQKRTGHTPEQIRRLYEFLVGNKWCDMKDRPLNPNWQAKYWLLTGEEYQRILRGGDSRNDAPLAKDGKPHVQVSPNSDGYKAPGAPGW